MVTRGPPALLAGHSTPPLAGKGLPAMEENEYVHAVYESRWWLLVGSYETKVKSQKLRHSCIYAAWYWFKTCLSTWALILQPHLHCQIKGELTRRSWLRGAMA